MSNASREFLENKPSSRFNKIRNKIRNDDSVNFKPRIHLPKVIDDDTPLAPDSGIYSSNNDISSISSINDEINYISK